ncbi:MAG TPA: aminopeptidase [Bacilli bacterium]|nr:aminopeptidase [Bacilli bacterium]
MILVRRLKEYAKLIVRVGANVKKGQDVIIFASVEQPEFVELVVKEAYKAGARKVEVRWQYQPLAKTKVKYERISTMAEITDWEKARFEHQIKVKPVRIYLESDDPNGSKGINQRKMAKARQKSYPIIKKYIDAMDNHYQWTIAGIPSSGWAKAVFPDLPRVQAIDALWEAILLTSRANGDAIKNWREHNANLEEKSGKLNSLHLTRLEYRASNGTNFSVGLLPNARFLAGGEHTLEGNFFNPNIPSEECFTTPRRGDAEGIVYSSKPLSYQGEVIDNFSVRFEKGKVVEVHADKNQALLEQMVKMDEGASYLGEVALVPYDSPIRQSGIIFQNTLYDENAACHLALGAGFNNCIEDYQQYKPEEFLGLGVNDSMIHVDFMIGTKDLDIDGITPEGKRIAIFRQGNWAI